MKRRLRRRLERPSTSADGGAATTENEVTAERLEPSPEPVEAPPEATNEPTSARAAEAEAATNDGTRLAFRS